MFSRSPESRPLASAAMLAIALVGCARGGAPTVPRRVDGEVVTGATVAPAIYESFLEGERAFHRGDFESARRAYGESSPASDPVVLGRLAEVEARLGRREEAARLLADGDRRFPGSEALAMARGRLAEAEGDAASALEAYRRAGELAPASPEPVLAAATLLEGASRPNEALDALARFVGDEPDRSPIAWWRTLALLVHAGVTPPSPAAIEEAAEALHRLAPRYDDRMRELAKRTLAEDRPSAALHILRPLPRSPADARTYLLALAAVEGSDAALSLLDRMADSLIGEALGRGQLLLELGRPAMAAALAEAILDAGERPSALLLLGRAERARGRTATALAALRRVPEDSSEYVLAQIEAARALADSGQSGRARRMLLDLVPSHGEAWPEITTTLESVSGEDANQ